MIVAFLAALCFWPTLQSSLSDADAYLRHVSAIAGFDGVTVHAAYDEMARHYRALQPGWFPLGPLPLAIWFADPPANVIRSLQLVLVISTFGTFAILARRLLGSSQTAIFAGVIALAAWQLRMPHDPVIGTSIVTPLLAEWVLLSYGAWLAYRPTGSAKWLLVSCASAVLMMLTDPLGWGFAALLVGLATLDRRGGRLRFLWLATALVVAGASLVLGAPHLPWQRDGSYVKDVLAQLIAPLPASYREFGSLHIGGTAGLSHGSAYVDDRFINVPVVDAWSWLPIVACSIAAFVALGAMTKKTQAQYSRTALFVGFGFWLIPALLLGPTGVWRDGVPLGQSFDGVYLQYFGIAILIAAALQRVREGAGRISLLAPSLAALAVLGLCYGNARANAASISKTQRSASSVALIERAGTAGFFGVLPEGRTLAVASSEPFANGIHSSASDAKYAIYHYSKRRYLVVATERLRRMPALDAWTLQTSRTSGIFVTLAHRYSYDGPTLLSDRAYGFSAFPSIRDELSIPARGRIIKTHTLPDGFSIQVRRTCGPVPNDLLYAAAQPKFTWGAGFTGRGPFGYTRKKADPESEMFMGSTATLVLRPTACRARPLIFRATIQSAAPATLVINYLKHTQRLSITSVAALIIETPKSRWAVPIHFMTDAPTADWDPIYFRYERDRPRELRLRFFAPSVVEEAVDPNSALERKRR